IILRFSALFLLLDNVAVLTEIYTLSLRDALPIWLLTSRSSICRAALLPAALTTCGKSISTGPSGPTRTLYGDRSPWIRPAHSIRSEEHTSELQSREKLVCRLLLEKKKHRMLTG